MSVLIESTTRISLAIKTNRNRSETPEFSRRRNFPSCETIYELFDPRKIFLERRKKARVKLHRYANILERSMRLLRQVFIVLWNLLLASPPYTAADSATSHANWRLINVTDCGNSNADRIVGGKNASMGAYPWIAQIGYTGAPGTTPGEVSYRCGGSLINDRHVITAAHCVTGLPKGYKVAGVRLGEHNTRTNPDCENGYCAEPVQDFKPQSITFHERYNNPRFKNDIAIIRLDRPADLNEFVLPICLVRGPLLEKSFLGEKAEVAGWGIYDIRHGRRSVILQTVTLPVASPEICRTVFRRDGVDFGDGQMCVGGKEGQDSCSGDSGGPLMKPETLDGYTRYYLIGLVSFGARVCGKLNEPAVYTRIASHVSWILENISA